MIRKVANAWLVVLTAASAGGPTTATSSERVATLGDAYVLRGEGNARWIIGNGAVTYSLRVARGGRLVQEGLFIAGSDDVVTMGVAPDAVVTIAGATYRLGERGSPFMVADVSGGAGPHFVYLDVRFHSHAHGLIATRHYVVYPGAGAVEMWTELASADGESHTVENLNAFALTVPIGTVEWITGLDTALDEGGAFTRRSRHLLPGDRLTLGSPNLSSLATVPYFSIGNGHRRFYSGLIWSGSWTTSLDAREEGVEVAAGLPAMSAIVRPERSVEGPHAFVGVVLDVPGADTAAVTRLVDASRAGRAFPALTTFNTWFLHGTWIDEDIIRADIDTAAAIGVELLQVDAGWYPGSRRDDRFDFTPGLGSWEADLERFPSGLAALRHYAHAQGMQFGLWVEPERVDLATVGRDGRAAPERVLAQQDGQYHPGVPNHEARDAQICLADPDARAWVLARLTELVDQVGPDHLKWDFNRWVACTRPGHGHPVDGGNYEHTRGLYEILAALRERYPAMTLENCAGGARRLDFAMARLTDSVWMDDKTAPSSHVRYNLAGLLAAFPAPYLFSFVMAHPDEPIQGNEDIPLLVRSRMPGVVGLTADLGALGERELDLLQQEIALAKGLRRMQEGAITYTLTPQARSAGQWQVVQQVSRATGTSLIFAFENDAPDSVHVFPREIRRELVYELRSIERGRLGRLRGEDLIAFGLALHHAPESGAQVLVLEPVAEAGRIE